MSFHKPSPQTCLLPPPVRDDSVPGIRNEQGIFYARCADLVCGWDYTLMQMGGEYRTEDNPDGEVWENRDAVE